MSLWPPSSSTSNIAFGRACETVASMTTACSFWSLSAAAVRRAFGVRVPRRGPRCLPKFGKSLIGEGQVSFPSRMAFPTPDNFRSLLRLATVDITPLRRHRDFRLLYIGRFVSLFGNQITFVAVPYQVFTLTHSTVAVGLLGVVELAALLTFALLGGALADALDRRLMVLMSEAALMVGSVILFGNSLLSHPIVWLVFVIVSLQGAFDAMQTPSLAALLPRLVDRDELAAAAALGSMRSTLGMIAGPALAGVLIAVAGLPAAYVVDIATFVVGLVWLWLMKAVAPPADAADMMSGIFRNVIWNQTIPDSLRGRLASIELLSFSGGPLLGNFESGVVASLFSVRFSVVSGGVLCVVGCAVALIALPAFWRYDARTWKAA